MSNGIHLIKGLQAYQGYIARNIHTCVNAARWVSSVMFINKIICLGWSVIVTSSISARRLGACEDASQTSCVTSSTSLYSDLVLTSAWVSSCLICNSWWPLCWPPGDSSDLERHSSAKDCLHSPTTKLFGRERGLQIDQSWPLLRLLDLLPTALSGDEDCLLRLLPALTFLLSSSRISCAVGLWFSFPQGQSAHQPYRRQLQN